MSSRIPEPTAENGVGRARNLYRASIKTKSAPDMVVRPQASEKKDEYMTREQMAEKFKEMDKSTIGYQGGFPAFLLAFKTIGNSCGNVKADVFNSDKMQKAFNTSADAEDAPEIMAKAETEMFSTGGNACTYSLSKLLTWQERMGYYQCIQKKQSDDPMENGKVCVFMTLNEKLKQSSSTTDW